MAITIFTTSFYIKGLYLYFWGEMNTLMSCYLQFCTRFPVCRGFPHATKQFSWQSWVFYNSIQFWYYLPGNFSEPRGQGLILTRLCPPPYTHFRHKWKARLSPELLTNRLQAIYRSEVPITPPWLWLFARASHRTLRNMLLTKLPVYYKRIKLRTVKCYICVGQGICEGTASMSSLQMSVSPYLLVFTNLKSLLTLSF